MKTMFWRLYPSYLIIIVILLGGFSFYTAGVVGRFFEVLVQEDLTLRSRLVEVVLRDYLTEGPVDYGAIGQVCQDVAGRSDTRVSVMMPDGRVIADSEAVARQMENHLERPEVQQALRAEDGFGWQSRFSATVGKEMLYLARVIRRDGQVTGIIRISTPLTRLRDTLHRVHIEMALGGLGVALLAALIGLGVSGRISRPLREMRQGVHRLAKGDFSRSLQATGTREIDELVKTFNKMTHDLEERISTIDTQRNEQQAILSSMAEGVLAVDNEGRLIMMNRSAETLLEVSFAQCRAASLETAVRNTGLHHLVQRVLGDGEAEVESELVMWTHGRERSLQVRGAALTDHKAQRIGVLLVLNDITRQRRLENVRRDFVSNVSHELKTPITSIKGFVETLLAGASGNPQDTQRFLTIIARQADRLHAITEDLLALSELEAQGDKPNLTFQAVSFRDIIGSAVALCELKLTGKKIEVRIDCDGALTGVANGHLLEQALVNLIDNAVKYSEPGSRIEIGAEAVDEQEVAISVRDHGCGIEQKHLPRLFERFYRVDRARSRELGGTGLGLSIVKHIIQVHKGRVTVQSQPGEGSVFTLYLPSEAA